MFRRVPMLFFAVLLLHLAGSWFLPLLDRDEPRFAEAAREMRERGDWVVPSFNARPRFDKPPMIYWMQWAGYAVFGENEFAARLPSALCAALVALVLTGWGARLFDEETGWRAALIFSLALQVTMHARAAVADMPMVLGVTAAAWAGWEWQGAAEARARRGWWLFFWSALAFGFLAKGPIALIPLGMLAWAGRGRAEQPARVRVVEWLLGAVWMLGLIALWGIPALLRTHGEFAAVGLGKHVIGRSMGALEGHGGKNWLGWLAALPFYFATIWPSFFPWSIWLVPATRHFWRTGLLRGSVERYLAAGVVLVFIIFTLVATKLPHYTLPAFPFLALLLAAWWRTADQRASTFWRTCLVTTATVLVLTLVAFPFAVPFFPVTRLAAEAAPWLRTETELAYGEYTEPSVIWTFRHYLRTYPTQIRRAALAGWMSAPTPRACLLPDELVPILFPQIPPDWRVVRASGINFVKAQGISLTLLINAH